MHTLENRPQGKLLRSAVETPPTLNEWHQRFQERAAKFPKNQTDVTFTFTTPAMINLLSDLHIGHPTTNYKRIEDEINVISDTENSYVIFVGDLINNMNWNPGQMEEAEQTPQQIGYLKSIIDHFVKKDKLLHAIHGDHDGWLKKSGYDIYGDLAEEGVSSSNGPTFFHMNVDQQLYEMAGAHQLPGHSIYNPTHPQARAYRFGSMHGADVIFSGHNHKKGVAATFQHELGQPKEVNLVALGPYKEHDDWLAKKGWPEQRPEEMFGVAVYLNALVHQVEVDLDIIKANKRMQTPSKMGLLDFVKQWF